MIDHGPHPDTDVPPARAQAERERLFDRDYALVESLRETGQLWPVAFFAAAMPVGVYLGARGVAGSTPIGGLALAAAALVGGGLALDTHLCKGTPASVYECRRCRRATDRWRGPTRDAQWVTSIVGQGSAAGQTPTPSRDARDQEVEQRGPVMSPPEPSSDDEPDPLFDTVSANLSDEDVIVVDEAEVDHNEPLFGPTSTSELDEPLPPADDGGAD